MTPHGPKSGDTEGFDRIKKHAASASAETETPEPDSADEAGGNPGSDDEALSVEEQATEVVEADLAVLLDTVTRERDDYLDMSRRVQADFENYKKRMLREQTSLLERAGENLVVSLLPVLDAFDLARDHLGDEAELSPDGKALVQAAALLGDTLAKDGLERIDEIGGAFDPTVHEAVEHQPAEDGDDAEEGTVVSGVLRAGYRWKGRVIRPAMVRVRG
jgi:molecular chaperone GrpE